MLDETELLQEYYCRNNEVLLTKVILCKKFVQCYQIHFLPDSQQDFLKRDNQLYPPIVYYPPIVQQLSPISFLMISNILQQMLQ